MEKLVAKYTKRPIVAEIQSLAQVKIALDDLVREYLSKELGYRQNHVATDVRIAVGGLSLLGAAVLLYFSMTTRFEAYKTYALFITSGYLFLTYAEYLFTKRFCSYVFDGTRGGERVRVVSRLQSPDTKYVLLAYIGSKAVPCLHTQDVCTIFDEEGTLLHAPFLKSADAFFSTRCLQSAAADKSA